MELTKSFSIDPQAGWVKRHNAGVAEVVRAFESDHPIRVPLINPDALWQHGFYMEEEGVDFEEYFTNPDEMLRVQLEAARRRRELPIYDFVLAEAPESWRVAVDQHPIIPYGWVGCELVYRHDSLPGHKAMNLSKHECLSMAMPDPETGGILSNIRQMLGHLQRQYENRISFLGRPVGPIYPFVDVYGVFDLAMAIRGQEIMVDMYEDPEFASAFLLKIAEWCERLADTWGERSGIARPHFSMSDHGIDMLSPQLYERYLVPVIKQINRRRGAEPGTRLHHCGRGAHLFPIMKKHFGLTHVEALTFPYVDIARVRREIGEEVWITGVVADDVIMQGPPERIRRTVGDLMRSGAKRGGRLCLEIGDMLPGTPMEHRIAYYEAVKEFGCY
jgi:uroporphyrinogen-III decarboxylase